MKDNSKTKYNFPATTCKRRMYGWIFLWGRLFLAKLTSTEQCNVLNAMKKSAHKHKECTWCKHVSKGWNTDRKVNEDKFVVFYGFGYSLHALIRKFVYRDTVPLTSDGYSCMVYRQITTIYAQNLQLCWEDIFLVKMKTIKMTIYSWWTST